MQPTRNKLYALKFCKDPSALATLRNEGKHLDRIPEDPRGNFVTPYELHDEKNRDIPFVAYEYVAGADFDRFLAQRFEQLGPTHIFGWSPPSHSRHFDWNGLEEELLENGLNGEEAALLVFCLKRREFRPKNAEELANHLDELYPQLHERRERFKLAQNHLERARAELDKDRNTGEGDYEKAIALCSKAIQLNPQNAEGYRLRAEVYLHGDENDKALADYSEIIRLNPKETRSYLERAAELLNTGESESVIEDCTRAVELDPENAEAYRLRGSALEDLERYDDAVADFTEAIRLKPACERLYLCRAEAWIVMEEEDGEEIAVHDCQRAIEDCSAAIRINPRNSACYRARAKFYRLSGGYDKAFADYAEAVRVDPKDVSSYLASAELYTSLGRYAEAIATYSDAVRLKSRQVYRSRGELYEKLGNYDAAIADYTRLIQEDDNAFNHKLWGEAYEKKGDFDRAIADYTEMIRLDPTAAWGYLHRADAYEKKGDHHKANADRQRGLVLRGGSCD